MIIDIHTHIAYNKLYPDLYLTGMLHDGNFDKKIVLNLLNGFLNDKDCVRMMHQMDHAGINKSILLIIDGGLGMGEAALSIEEIYEHYFNVLNLYPERLLVFAGMDPRRGKAGFNLFKKGILEYGFKGLKLYPPMGFAVSDSLMTDYYQFCSDFQLPILLHTGPSLPSLQNHFADPKYMYDIAIQYPDINFILAHAGYNLFSASVQSLLGLQNVFFDIAGFQTHFKKLDDNAKEVLGKMFEAPYNTKVLFGTDWPLFNLMTPLKTHVAFIKDLFEQLNIKKTEALDNVLYKNAVKALRISQY